MPNTSVKSRLHCWRRALRRRSRKRLSNSHHSTEPGRVSPGCSIGPDDDPTSCATTHRSISSSIARHGAPASGGFHADNTPVPACARGTNLRFRNCHVPPRWAERKRGIAWMTPSQATSQPSGSSPSLASIISGGFSVAMHSTDGAGLPRALRTHRSWFKRGSVCSGRTSRLRVPEVRSTQYLEWAAFQRRTCRVLWRTQ